MLGSIRMPKKQDKMLESENYLAVGIKRRIPTNRAEIDATISLDGRPGSAGSGIDVSAAMMIQKKSLQVTRRRMGDSNDYYSSSEIELTLIISAL